MVRLGLQNPGKGGSGVCMSTSSPRSSSPTEDKDPVGLTVNHQPAAALERLVEVGTEPDNTAYGA